MLPTSTDMARVVGDWVRRADRELAGRAARNAAAGLEGERSRRLDEARTLRDLRRLGLTAEAGDGGPGRARRR